MKGSLSLRSSFMILLLLPPTTHAAYASLSGLECLCLYVGVEAQLRYMPFDRNVGTNLSGATLFPKRFPQGNMFVGIKLNDDLGLEGGYESSTNKHRNVTVVSRGNGSFNFNNTARIHGPHINVVGYHTLSVCPDIKLVGMLGLAYLKNRLISSLVSVNGILANNSATFSKSKLLARLGGGLQYTFNPYASLRGTVIWENTRRFREISDQNQASDIPVKPKNSMILGLGFVLNF